MLGRFDQSAGRASLQSPLAPTKWGRGRGEEVMRSLPTIVSRPLTRSLTLATLSPQARGEGFFHRHPAPREELLMPSLSKHAGP